MSKCVCISLFLCFFVPGDLLAGEVRIGGESRLRLFTVSDLDFTEATRDSDSWIDLRLRLTGRFTAGIAAGVLEVDLLNGPDGLVDLDGDGVPDSSEGNIVFGRRDPTGGSSRLNRIGIRQASLFVGVPALLTLSIGRQEIKLGHGIILYNTVDQITLSHRSSALSIRIGSLILQDREPGGGLPGVTGGRHVAYSVEAELTPTRHWTLGWFMIFGDAVGERLQVYAPYFHGKIGPVRIHGEADFLLGKRDKNVSFEGQNLSLSALTPVGPIEIGLTFLYATGQDRRTGEEDENINAISGDFRLGGILFRDRFNNHDGVRDIANPLNRPDLPGRGVCNLAGAPQHCNLGVRAIRLSAGLRGSDSVGMELALLFARTAEEDAQGDKDLGVEVDLALSYQISESLSLTTGYAFFTGGDALVGAGQRKEGITQLELGVVYRF